MNGHPFLQNHFRYYSSFYRRWMDILFTSALFVLGKCSTHWTTQNKFLLRTSKKFWNRRQDSGNHLWYITYRHHFSFEVRWNLEIWRHPVWLEKSTFRCFSHILKLDVPNVPEELHLKIDDNNDSEAEREDDEYDDSKENDVNQQSQVITLIKKNIQDN